MPEDFPIRLLWPHTCLVSTPFLGGYTTPSGLYVEFNEHLPKIYTTVLKTYRCTEVKEGDTIIFLKHHVESYYLGAGAYVYAMDERSALAVLEDWS